MASIRTPRREISADITQNSNFTMSVVLFQWLATSAFAISIPDEQYVIHLKGDPLNVKHL